VRIKVGDLVLNRYRGVTPGIVVEMGDPIFDTDNVCQILWADDNKPTPWLKSNLRKINV